MCALRCTLTFDIHSNQLLVWDFLSERRNFSPFSMLMLPTDSLRQPKCLSKRLRWIRGLFATHTAKAAERAKWYKWPQCIWAVCWMRVAWIGCEVCSYFLWTLTPFRSASKSHCMNASRNAHITNIKISHYYLLSCWCLRCVCMRRASSFSCVCVFIQINILAHSHKANRFMHGIYIWLCFHPLTRDVHAPDRPVLYGKTDRQCNRGTFWRSI